MFFAGDEFCNTSYGNNNPYCQDNIVSWLDWNNLKKHKDIFEFFKKMIAFRKKHTVMRKDTQECSLRYPCVSKHGVIPFEPDLGYESHVIGVMYAGRENKRDDMVYLAINAYWEEVEIKLPTPPRGKRWKIVFDTYQENSYIEKNNIYLDSNNKVRIKDRTVMIFTI